MELRGEPGSLSRHEPPGHRHRRGEDDALHVTLAALEQATREAAQHIGLSVEDTEDAVTQCWLMYFAVREAAVAAGHPEGTHLLSDEQTLTLARAAVAESGRARRRRRNREVEWGRVCGIDAVPAFDPADPRPSPHEVVENQALKDAIDGAVSNMPSEIGALIRAHYVEGVTYAALARRCGCSADALRLRLRRELERARRRLQWRGWDFR